MKSRSPAAGRRWGPDFVGECAAPDRRSANPPLSASSATHVTLALSASSAFAVSPSGDENPGVRRSPAAGRRWGPDFVGECATPDRRSANPPLSPPPFARCYTNVLRPRLRDHNEGRNDNTAAALSAVTGAAKPLLLTTWQQFEMERALQLRLFRCECSLADIVEAGNRCKLTSPPAP
jgi:hypothetical protein